jgi:hypothetical protein
MTESDSKIESTEKSGGSQKGSRHKAQGSWANAWCPTWEMPPKPKAECSTDQGKDKKLDGLEE